MYSRRKHVRLASRSQLLRVNLDKALNYVDSTYRINTKRTIGHIILAVKESTGDFEPTSLGYAILGILLDEPRSGYAIRKIFEQTAMGEFSSSPGSIYPALKRLEVQHFIEETKGVATMRKSTSIYRVTKQGKSRFLDWLRRPIGRRDITHGMKSLLLRFGFMRHLPVAEVLVFLQVFEQQIRTYSRELESFLKGEGAALPLLSRLALDNGIRGYRAQRTWAARAIQLLETDHE